MRHNAPKSFSGVKRPRFHCDEDAGDFDLQRKCVLFWRNDSNHFIQVQGIKDTIKTMTQTGPYIPTGSDRMAAANVLVVIVALLAYFVFA